MNPINPIIELDHVTVTYQDLVALDDVTLTVAPGSFLKKMVCLQSRF